MCGDHLCLNRNISWESVGNVVQPQTTHYKNKERASAVCVCVRERYYHILWKWRKGRTTTWKRTKSVELRGSETVRLKKGLFQINDRTKQQGTRHRTESEELRLSNSFCHPLFLFFMSAVHPVFTGLILFLQMLCYSLIQNGINSFFLLILHMKPHNDNMKKKNFFIRKIY